VLAQRFVALLPLIILALQLTNPAAAETYIANPKISSGPESYLNIVARLEPGDTLILLAGTYPKRLNLNDIQGTADNWITISGPRSSPPAVITTDSNCCNIVQLGNTRFVALKNLTIDANSEDLNTSIDAINAKGKVTHDILIENCIIKGVSHSQLTTGISTKSTAWNWIIRGNTILDAGTGIYLGNSTGEAPFVGGLIEGNVFVDSIGYNMQIKQQNPYTAPVGFPTGPQKTIIRHNVYLKRVPQTSLPESKKAGGRPNLLVGGFPDTGVGAQDLYEIYGNLFYENRDKEALLQATGRVSIHDNIFVGGSRSALFLTDHNTTLRLAHVYNNTIYGAPRGIYFTDKARDESVVAGNLIFSQRPISGPIDDKFGNITDSVANAPQYVRQPSMTLGSMDFYPLHGKSRGPIIDMSVFSGQSDFDVDFNGTPKLDFQFRGAYSGSGTNPGWQLAAHRKGHEEAILRSDEGAH